MGRRSLQPSNKDIFLQSFDSHNSKGSINRIDLDNVAESHLDTLTAIRSGYFSIEVLSKISEESGRRLAQQVKQLPLQEAWQKVAEDFHNNSYWGYQTQTTKPKVKKKKNEMIGYLWTAFQAIIIMKFITLYFGINAADLDIEWHYRGLGIALLISVVTLMYFAWRKSKTYRD